MNRYSSIVMLLAVGLLGADLPGVNVVSNPGETRARPRLRRPAVEAQFAACGNCWDQLEETISA